MESGSSNSPPGSPPGSAAIAPVGGGMFILILLTCWISRRCLKKMKERRRRSTLMTAESAVSGRLPSFTIGRIGCVPTSYTYSEIEAATCGFSKENVLGEGGYGLVYRGQLASGQLVAVKQLKVGGDQGEEQFRTEVEIISRIHHRHLVSLVGYCIAKNQRLLVYDYIPNGTLAHHLHGKGVPSMEWDKRRKVAISTARGLTYLHEDCCPRIIHRDIKASNILLDENFEAKVADFGLAKLTSDAYTHVTTRVMGTFGYLAPEYALSGMLTEKSDVYSFGVVLLELFTGQRVVDTTRPSGEENIVEWAKPLLSQALDNKAFEPLVDSKLNDKYDKAKMLRMVDIITTCIHPLASKRPRMGQIMHALENDIPISKVCDGAQFGDDFTSQFNFANMDSKYNSSSTSMRVFHKFSFEDNREHNSGFENSLSRTNVWKPQCRGVQAIG